ncbi:hypothetical protein GBL_3073 [Geobacillus kaustophilus GBlys]|uniref:Uncharacterized protein n=1 Tax=Geobacillus kaustophilus GBlys TaxID=1337888 RepID=U2WVN6_GEOKU|nr:hypothetical protein GBL_3073 [Geobacillus kaustophilus GBlys]
MTGFVLTLCAMKSPVQSAGLVASKQRMCTAIENRVLICFT